MRIRILAIGRLKEKYWREAFAEYDKRLRPYAHFEALEGPEADTGRESNDREKELVLEKEGRFFLGKISEDDYNIALDLDGDMVTSEELAAVIEREAMMKGKNVNFLIGGSLGMSDAVKRRCHWRIAFGRATFPHQMIRVFLAEQIYRGIKIIRGEPYHK